MMEQKPDWSELKSKWKCLYELFQNQARWAIAEGTSGTKKFYI